MAWVVMVPPVPVTTESVPSPPTPSTLLRGSATIWPAVGVSVTVTIATTPFEIGLPFIPLARQISEPMAAPQFRDLPAPVNAAPALALMEATSLVEYGSVHCRPDGGLEDAFKERFNDTVPPCGPAPDERVRFV